MKRNAERKLIVAASVWHFINGILTIFVFGMWFKTNGDIAINEMYPELVGGSSSFVDILYTVLTTYSVIVILVGAANIYCLRYMKDDEINRKWQIWMVLLLVLSFLSVDVIASLFYLFALVSYSSKNKAIRLSHEKERQYQLI